MEAPYIAVVVTGDPVPAARAQRGGWVDLIRAAAPGFEAFTWRAFDVRELQRLPPLTGALGVIVTGSPFSVTDDLPWIEPTAEHLRALVEQGVPVLGICFGHQLLGQALGGRVAVNPRGREIGSVKLALARPDPLLGAPGEFVVNSTHVDAVLELPPGAELLGSTALDRHAAVRFAPAAWGVQFHPEIDAAVMRLYVEARSEALTAEGFDLGSLERAIEEAPRAAALIPRFLELARQRAASTEPLAATGPEEIPPSFPG